MKKEIEMYGMKFTVSNKREEETIHILKLKIHSCLSGYDFNIYDDKTMNITRRELSNINGVLSCLFYMGITKEPYNELDIPEVRERHIYAY